MKNIKITGKWGDETVWREETARETINRMLGKDADLSADIYIALNENRTKQPANTNNPRYAGNKTRIR